MAFIDQRHWLLRFESLIYEIRLENLDKKEALKCIEKQIEEYYKKVGFTLRKDPSTKKFIIPFEDAPFLLESHQTTIQQGMVLVEDKRLSSVARSLFSQNLEHEMKELEQQLPAIYERENRLEILVKELLRNDVGQPEFHGVTDFGKVLTSKDVDDLAFKHFPLCMYQMHGFLNKQHKLYHHGRLEFGLFLKGIGLSLKESKSYFNSKYSKSSENASKLNEYNYLIEHMYGQKGSKKNYSPFGCSKLMKSEVSNDQSNGCPYKSKRGNIPFLKKLLERKGLTSDQAKDVALKNKEFGPQVII